MRATRHSGRVGKDGTYSAKHNDRNFDVENAKHIDEERSSQNMYSNYTLNNNISFEEAEKKFYKDNFEKLIEKRNERYRKSGHKERIKTVEDYRKNPKTCPEEIIYQIGNQNDNIDSKELINVFNQFSKWHDKTYPNIKILDMALHMDEATPHIHVRQVWLGHDKDGNLEVSQNKALEEMGIERPDISKPKDRHNNPKMTYTKDCRDKYIEICLENGLDIELDPKEANQKNLSIIEYKIQREQEKLRTINSELQEINLELQEASKTIDKANTIQKEIKASKNELESLQGEIDLLIQQKIELSTKKKLFSKSKTVEIDEEELERLKNIPKEMTAALDSVTKVRNEVYELLEQIKDHDTYIKRELENKVITPELSRAIVEEAKKEASQQIGVDLFRNPTVAEKNSQIVQGVRLAQERARQRQERLKEKYLDKYSQDISRNDRDDFDNR